MAGNRSLQKDLTQGNVRKCILAFAVPLMISNLIQSAYNAVDMYFVGAYTGTASLAAVSVCGPILNVMIITLSGMSAGVTVVIGSWAGKKDMEEIKKAGNTAFALYALLALVTTVLGLVCADWILTAVQTPAEAFEEARQYLMVVFAGLIFMFGYNLIGALQRGMGDSVSSMYFVMVAALVNVALDYLLIAVFRMGAFGAAVATVAAEMVSFMLGLWQFRRQKHVIRFGIRNLKFDKKHLKSILYFGVPTAVNEVMVNVAMLTVSGVANSFGLAQSAAYGVGGKINGFAIFSDGAMNQTMSSFASQNISAGKQERAIKGLKESMLISACIALATTVAVYFFAPQLAALFDKNPEVIRWTVQYLHITILSYVLFAMVGPLIGFIRGTGNIAASVGVGFVAQCCLRIPFSFIFGHLWGFPGVGMAVLIGPLSSVTMYSFYIFTGRWKRGLEYLRKM